MNRLSTVCQAVHVPLLRWRKLAWPGWRCWPSNRGPVKVPHPQYLSFMRGPVKVPHLQYLSFMRGLMKPQHQLQIQYITNPAWDTDNWSSIVSLQRNTSQCRRKVPYVPYEESTFYGVLKSMFKINFRFCECRFNVYMCLILLRNRERWRDQTAGWRNQRSERVQSSSGVGHD